MSAVTSSTVAARAPLWRFGRTPEIFVLCGGMEIVTSSNGGGGGSVGASDACFFAASAPPRTVAGACERRPRPGFVFISSSNFGFLAMDLAR